jgi:DNA-3-methyladenine glycosylase
VPFADLFQQDPVTAARGLIGARLVCGGCSGIVVETEAYAAVGDEAAHTFFKPSAREFVANHEPGAAYVYLNYGMYWLANVLTKTATGEEGFVLLRALEPERGIATMRRRRAKEKARDLCSGPGKLTIALGIDGDDHGGTFLGDSARFWFEEDDGAHEVVDDVRVGINRATDLRWRFLAKSSEYVSRPLGRA